MRSRSKSDFGLALLWSAMAVCGLVVWAYAAVGFWAVNERWLKAAWKVLFS